MNLLKKKVLIITGMLLGVWVIAGAQKLNTVNIKNLKDLQEYFTYSPHKDIKISGHRGGMLPGYPENCIPSCQKTLSLMPSFFEIDPRLTKDSVLVIMHDSTLNRTTTGTGRVADYTYKQLQQFRLKDREGNVTSYKIPTLIEMLDWGRGKTVFNLDNKKVPWEMYIKLLKDHNYANIILSVRSLKEALFYYKRVNTVMLCVEISNMQQYRDYERSGIPWNRIMAYIGLKTDPKQQEVYNLLHQHGVMCMSSLPSTIDKLKGRQRELGYQQELNNKPDIIETDYPSLFAAFSLKK